MICLFVNQDFIVSTCGFYIAYGWVTLIVKVLMVEFDSLLIVSVLCCALDSLLMFNLRWIMLLWV